MIAHDFRDIFMTKNTMAIRMSSFVKSVQSLYIFIGLSAFFFWLPISTLYILGASPLRNKCSISIFIQSRLPYYS